LSKAGVNQNRIDLICDAIAFHTSALASLCPPQVSLVGTGAGADVFGSGLKSLSTGQLSEILAAFPRLNFKVEFRKSLLEYCVRSRARRSGRGPTPFAGRT
jgi:hypothetical protein